MKRKDRITQEDILAKKAALILQNPNFTRRQILEWRSGQVLPFNRAEMVLKIGPFQMCIKKIHDNRPESEPKIEQIFERGLNA